MTKIQLFFSLLVSAFLGGFMSLSAYFLYVQPIKYKDIKAHPLNDKISQSAIFKQATQQVRPAVVHIKLTQPRNRFQKTKDAENIDEYDESSSGHYGSGSGVIISKDGYIVTNNHVVENAQTLLVILPDKRSFKARVIGTDMATDLAVLKIEGTDLPVAKLATTDVLEIGDWVLAIGNPFDLTASVTAGIVSGKGRNINLLKHDIANQKNAVEAFIQTDAAINPGNSGGALINMKGEVVGINTAIATHTGYYTGFSFAIPIALVRKVVNDLKEYGETRRALLGAKLIEINGKLAQQERLKELKGVYIAYVADNSSASVGGLKNGDVILTLDQHEVNSVPDFNAHMALYTPGQSVKITYMRSGKKQTIAVILRDTHGQTQGKDKNKIKIVESSTYMGAEFTLPTKTEKDKLGLRYGIKVQTLRAGKLMNAGVKAGFIITNIDGKQIIKIEDVKNTLEASKKNSKTVTIEGYYWGAGKAYYALGW